MSGSKILHRQLPDIASVPDIGAGRCLGPEGNEVSLGEGGEGGPGPPEGRRQER